LNFITLVVSLCSPWFVVSFGFIEERISLWSIKSATKSTIPFPNGFWGKASNFLPQNTHEQIFNAIRSIRFLIFLCIAVSVFLFSIYFAPKNDRIRQIHALIAVNLVLAILMGILWYIMISHYQDHSNIVNSFTIQYDYGFDSVVFSTTVVFALLVWNLFFSRRKGNEGERRPLEPGQVGYNSFERDYAA